MLLRECLEQPLIDDNELERGRRELLLKLSGGTRPGGSPPPEAEAARAAWLYYHEDLTQGDVARELADLLEVLGVVPIPLLVFVALPIGWV